MADDLYTVKTRSVNENYHEQFAMGGRAHFGQRILV